VRYGSLQRNLRGPWRQGGANGPLRGAGPAAVYCRGPRRKLATAVWGGGSRALDGGPPTPAASSSSPVDASSSPPCMFSLSLVNYLD
jgi:hypothetical protein